MAPKILRFVLCSRNIHHYCTGIWCMTTLLYNTVRSYMPKINHGVPLLISSIVPSIYVWCSNTHTYPTHTSIHTCAAILYHTPYTYKLAMHIFKMLCSRRNMDETKDLFLFLLFFFLFMCKSCGGLVKRMSDLLLLEHTVQFIRESCRANTQLILLRCLRSWRTSLKTFSLYRVCIICVISSDVSESHLLVLLLCCCPLHSCVFTYILFHRGTTSLVQFSKAYTHGTFSN